MIRVAALPMYNVSPALAQDWRGLLSDVLLHVDDTAATVEPGDDLYAFWRRPDLLVSQTCGYPFALGLHEHVQLIATPHFDAPGCDGADYSSVLITHADAPFDSLEACRGSRAAYNSEDSNSGYNALRHAVAPLSVNGRFFRETVETGSHLGSLRAIAEQRADIAAIDCVTFAFIRDTYPDLMRAVREIGYTRASPGLPWVASKAVSPTDMNALRAAFDTAIASQAARAQRLRLKGWSLLTHSDYERIAQMEREACALGYARLA